ncbi:MAG: nickel pincer cofactor biosynthesis protein LarC [Cyanobacteria bacterium P01_F01_bin.153]
MKIAYLECPTGIAGDMCLGALVDVGVPLDVLRESLAGLGISDEFSLRAEKVLRNGQQATKVYVDLTSAEEDPVYSAEKEALAVREKDHHGHGHRHDHDHHDHSHHHGHDYGHKHSHNHDHQRHHGGRHLPEIRDRIKAAQLTPRAERWSIGIFESLAIAEGAVHGQPPETVHFHEVGATDALVDIVGTCIGLDWLGVNAIFCSPLPVGGGVVRAAHGRLPVPVPAVLKLWEQRQVPVYYNGIDRELVTPTGAAIATTLAQDFGPPPAMTLQKIGLGAGNRDLSLPNILRLWLGETADNQMGKVSTQRHGHSHSSDSPPQPAIDAAGKDTNQGTHQDTVMVLQTQIDDLSPQGIAYAQCQLFQAGALDVFSQSITMKKSRLGALLTVICRPNATEICEKILFQETTTLGIRRQLQQRTILDRQQIPIETNYGKIRIKIAGEANSKRQLKVINIHPEYDDVSACANATNTPWLTVHQAAITQWKKQHPEQWISF